MSYLLVQAQGQILDVTISNPGGGNATMYADAALTTPINTWPQRLNGVDTLYYVGRDPSFWNVSVKEHSGNVILSQPFTAGPGQPAVVAPLPSSALLAARAGRGYTEANAVTGAEETQSRMLTNGANTITSGQARFAAFTARSALVVSTITYVGGGAAASALTVNRQAIYTVDNLGNLTFLQSTANGGAAFGASTTQANALLAPVTLVPGQRYALALLHTGTTGSVYGATTTPLTSGRLLDLPWVGAAVVATDLTAAALNTVAYGALSGAAPLYMKVS